jgi:NAD(P)-dependent dehydrogenase (short-subunit alcohol dehydrogenase family)
VAERRLDEKVALVTGANRGAGKGIALVLGEEGAAVYLTGRSVRGKPTTLGRPGTIDDTAEEASARGGTGIAVRCDHTDDVQVEALFERIRSDQGRLDLLVNNAWSGYELSPDPSLAFWEIDWRHWDLMFDGGLRALERMDLSPERAARTESAEFPGRAIAALAADSNVLSKSGGVFTTPELAREYGFSDVDGKQQSAFWDEHWAS